MSLPSNLPSASWVSQRCYDARYPVESLAPALRDRVDQLAGFFHARGDFESVFIRLVPWNDLVGPPNNGHAAIADLLISRGAHAALSSNFDPIIENWALVRKIFMRGALTGQEAESVEFAGTNPLIKFHGCIQREPRTTFWTQGQLTDPVVQNRVTTCTDWMNLHLPQRHLVVVGFWTDWPHLNNALANAFTIQSASAVTVIDPASMVELQAKAPILWDKLNNLSQEFEHVQASGADALEELRTAYSKAWVRKYYALGQTLVEREGGTVAVLPTPDSLSGEELYDLRRDAEGIPHPRAAVLKAPASNAAEAAAVHVLLLNAGATQQGAWFQHNGRSIRVINGGGRGLMQVKEEYIEPIPQPEIVICANASVLGVPGRVISSGQGASTVRPAPGGNSRWLTVAQARVELAI